MTQFIKAPYNFVPVSETVVFPEWGNAVSHDIPFANSESGNIKVKITAESPIFVRNGQAQKDDSVGVFSQHQNRFFIPGSSIKGAIRNVLEIMTFSKMNVNNQKYSVRDFQNRNLYKIPEISKQSQAGWLSYNNGKYTLEECGTAGRISHKEIDNFYSTNYRRFFLENGGFQGSNSQHKSATFKYQKFGENNLVNTFEQVYLEEDNPVDARKFFKVSSTSNLKGTIVFTGQAGPRKEQKGKKANGKIYEFVFFTPKNMITIAENDNNDPNKEVIKNFKFAMYEHESSSWSDDWKWRRRQLADGEKIPVFYRKDKNGEIKDMGLSYLYKITYDNSVTDLLSNGHKETASKPDFAETIFGYINNEVGLKGRVHFSHAFNTNNAIELPQTTDVLSSPKASYYPTYIRQDIRNGKVNGEYQTFMNKNAKLAGWKKYPVHSNGIKQNPSDAQKILTKYTPLDKGVEFELTIRFHNLRKVEIGALLSALTLHNTQNTFHSLGMAKPLGYGKTKFDVLLSEGFKYQFTDYLKSFEAYMSASIDIPKWAEAEQITELITMSSAHENEQLEYMKMNKGGENEFVKAKSDKNNKEALDKYSVLVGANKVKSLIVDSDIDAARQLKAAELKIFAKGANIYELIETEIEYSKKLTIGKFEQTKAEISEQVKELLQKLKDKKSAIEQRKQELVLEQKQEFKKQEANKGLQNFFEVVQKKTEFKEFKDFCNRMKQYYKIANIDKASVLPDNDILYCKEKLTEIYNNNSSSKRERNLFKERYIKDISIWLGDEKANSWLNSVSG